MPLPKRAIAASFLIYVFDADLTALIQLYVVGVFTAFTLSQAGMVRRWRRLKEPGWRRSMTINTIAAGTNPVSFGFRWFLPSIWRYRRA